MRHALALGVLLLHPVLLGSCGVQGTDPRLETGPADMGTGQPVVPTEPSWSGAPPNATAEPPTPAPLEPAPAPAPRRWGHDLRALGVVSFLQEICSSCFQPLDGSAGESDADLTVLTRLVDEGEIIPGDRGASPLWQRLSQGLLPPGASRGPTRGELAVLGELIDQLPLDPQPGCEPLPFFSQDDVLAAVARDLASTDSPATTRYSSLTYASNAGLCGVELERHRSALFKVVNSVSTQPAIVMPKAIDPNGVLYRIDLRDYGWDRPLDLEDDGEIDFDDAWLAFTAAASGYSQELTGPEADALKLATRTAVPLLPAHVLVYWAATGGDLYYSLIGARQNADDTRAALGVHLIEDVLDNRVQRAGFQGRTGPATQVLRFEQAGPPGRSYWLLQTELQGGDESMFQDPLDLFYEGGLSIGQLPNGMLAFGIENAEGGRLRSAPICLVECDRNRLGTLAACHACHEGGPLPVSDLLRDYTEANLQQFDNETLAHVRAQYPGSDAMAQLITADSSVTLGAAREAGVVQGGPEPLSYAHSQFELGDLALNAVAAELGVTPSMFREQLGVLSSRLQGLAEPGGFIDRQTLINEYAKAACTLHASARNHPLVCR